MKILQVTPGYPPTVGGVETHVQELSKGFVERGHEVTVITADAGSDVASNTDLNGVTVKRYRGISPNGAYHIAPSILGAVRDIEADIIHAHNYHGFPLLFAAAGAGETPLVTTPHYHGGSASSFRDYLLKLYKPLGGWALRQSAAVLAVSDWEASQLHDDFQIDPEVIPNGLHVHRFRDATPEQRNRPYLLTVGRLEKYKGVQHAIRTLTELPGYELVVAGKGPYLNDLQQLATDCGVANRVSFEGYVSDERLPRLYAGSSVYLTLSKFEAYGMTIGEALAAGTPCVVRTAGGLTDWTNRPDCIAISNPNPGRIAAAVRTATNLNAPLESLPDWEQVIDEVESVYAQILADS